MNEIREKLSAALELIGPNAWQCAAKDQFVRRGHLPLSNLVFRMETAIDALKEKGSECLSAAGCEPIINEQEKGEI